jgi:hypothetical protein
MRAPGHGTDELGSLLGASREPPKEGHGGDGGQQGTFSEPHGITPYSSGQISQLKLGQAAISIYLRNLSLSSPEKFQSFTGRSLYRKSSGANYAKEAAELLLNLP